MGRGGSTPSSVKTGRTQEEIAKDMPARCGEGGGPEESGGRNESFARRSQPMPGFFEPMSARCWERIRRKGREWLVEIKWDGVRALCFVENGNLQIYTRNGNRCERQYPELAVLPHHVNAKQAILDGEIAVLDAQGVSRFALIQPRIMNQDANAVAQWRASSR